MIPFCQLLFIGALAWSTVTASKLVGAKKSEFHMMMENNWPDPDPSINHFPHQTSCHYFYLVLSEDDVSIKKCPDGKLFDYFDHKCVEKESARCWSRRFSKIIHDHNHVHKAPKKFKCPYAYGKFPDITDCSRYYQCLSGKAKTKKCAPFEYFDKIKRDCMAEINAVCADETDVVEHGYKCPRSQGSFAFSNDCSKYYECIEKRPDVRTCSKDKLFDEKKRKCISSEIAHCGLRYNPYEEKTGTSAGSIQEETKKITDGGKATSAIIFSQTATTDKPLFLTSKEIEFSITASASDNKNNKAPKEVSQSPIEVHDSSENDISKESLDSSEEHHKDDLKESKESSEEHHKDDLKESKESSEDTKKLTSKENPLEDNSKENSREDNSKENSLEDDSKESTNEPDIDGSNVSEFITTVSESSTNQKTFSEPNKLTSTETHPSTSDDMTCHPKDLTCIIVKNRVVRCPAADGFFPHPKDKKHFLHCSNFKIHQRKCPKNLIFQDSLKACAWPLNQAENNP